MKGSVSSSRRPLALHLSALLLVIVTLSIGMPLSASATGFHTVTFAENSTISDPVFSTQTASVPTALTNFANITPSFVNAGHVFLHWNTSADGTAITYLNGATFDFATGTVLYAIWASDYHTVTFAQNENASDPVYLTQTANVSTALTSFAVLTPAFVNAGYSFVDWNTSASGSGISYLNGATFDFVSSVVLYAQWASVPLITSNFVINGGSGTIAPVSNPIGSSTTLPTSSGMSNPGYTFSGWNTAADGSGTTYAGGATYVFTGDQTLYAQWTPDVYVVTYSAGGGTVSPATSSYTFATTGLTLPTPTNTGYIFSGWFTSASGGTLVGLAGAPFTPGSSAVLYAQWTPDVYVVTYSAGGGTVSPATSSYTFATTGLALPTPTNTGYIFSGWFTSASGGTLVGLAGAPFTPGSSVTLYAQWTRVSSDTLTFNANGGSGSVASITGAHGSTITLPGQAGLLMAGFVLAHWNTSAKDTGTSYAAGQVLTLSGSSTLYAQWTGHVPAVLFGAVGTFSTNSSRLSNKLKSQVKRLALTIKAKKYHAVTLYGYTATTGLRSLNFSLSRARATVVANYLRTQLRLLKVKGVTIRSAGEGSVANGSSAAFSRVEVFVV